MRPLRIADSAAMILGLQDEIRRSEESRYDHRLHGVLLVAQGMTCPAVAKLLGDAPRTVEYWVRGFEEQGLGRPARGRTGRAAATAKRETAAASQRRFAADATSARSGRQSVGRQNSGGLDPTPVWDQFGGPTMSALVPAVGFPLAQTAPPRLPGLTRNGSRPIKKTPSVNGRSYGRPVGH